METANILKRGYFNETQKLSLTTTKLTPNSHSNFTTRFQIPSIGTVLDSNSSLIWDISWDGYDSGVVDELVLLKNFSGGLNTILRCRLYIQGKLIFQNEDVGHYVHILKQGLNPDTLENVVDLQIGSQHGYYLDDEGRFKLGEDGSKVRTFESKYVRAVGSGTKSVQMSLLLSEIFKGLNYLQLPTSLYDIRLEVDWETDWDEVVYIANETVTPIIASRKTISITNPLLLLDFIDYGLEDSKMLLEYMKQGMAIPYVNTIMITKSIPANTTATSVVSDLQINLSGKLIMKIFVSHRTNNLVGGVLASEQIGNGRCRSSRGLDFSYNLFVNDLSLYDLNVLTDSEQYGYLTQALQSMPAVLGGCYSYTSAGAIDDEVDVNSDSFTQSGIAIGAGGSVLPMTALKVRDMVMNTQSYIGFDMSKFSDDQVLPSNAGYRVNNSPLVLRIIETGSVTANSKEAMSKTVQIFIDEVKVLQLKGKDIDVFDA